MASGGSGSSVHWEGLLAHLVRGGAGGRAAGSGGRLAAPGGLLAGAGGSSCGRLAGCCGFLRAPALSCGAGQASASFGAAPQKEMGGFEEWSKREGERLNLIAVGLVSNSYFWLQAQDWFPIAVNPG